MQIRLNIFRTLVITAFVLTACETQIDWPLQDLSDEIIMIDGNITSETKIHEIKILKPFNNANSMPEAVSGANVLVSSEDHVYSFIEDPARPGHYQSADTFAGKAGRTYSLIINQNNSIISAKAKMAPAADFIFLRYVRQSNTKLFSIAWVANPYNASRPAMYEILLDWSSVPGYEHASAEDTRARLLYFTLPTLDVSQIFAPTMESVLFPPGTIIIEKRYSLTTEHAEYIRALLSETSWQGSLFNSAAANLPTNLSNNGIGYFGACAVTIKTEIAGSMFPITESEK